MIFVLLLLVILFSSLTIKQQFPIGAEAGTQVADKLERSSPRPTSVLVVTRDTAEDRQYAAAAVARLTASNIDVFVVNGGPVEARVKLEEIFATGGKIDAIIANDVTVKWAVFDRFEQLSQVPRVIPQSYAWPDFLKATNLIGVANQTALYAIIAIGMTMVIITGGIDLSVGSLVALSAVVTALTIRDFGGGVQASVAMVIMAGVLGIFCCAAAGLLNGLLVTNFGIPPFIATLGMMMMASGLAFRLAEGRSIPELPSSFFWLGRQATLGVPNPILLMIVFYAVAHLVMSKTVFGRYVYAIGGNPQAAVLSGVPVKRVLVIVYGLCAGLAGLGGIILASQLSAGDPKFGLMYELEVIAAVVVGGTSLLGGRGKIFGTLIGAFIIAVIRNGMNLIDVDPFNQKIVLGGVLTLAVLLDTLKRGKRSL